MSVPSHTGHAREGAALTVPPTTISSVWSTLGRKGGQGSSPSTCHLLAPSFHHCTSAHMHTSEVKLCPRYPAVCSKG